MTPVAEFNHYACAYSAARLYALTSPNPSSTLPPSRSGFVLPPNWSSPKQLNLTLFPLDVTTLHLLPEHEVFDAVTPLDEAGSPLASWCGHFLAATYRKMGELYRETDPSGQYRPQDVDLSLHDPMCVYYVLTRNEAGDGSDGWQFWKGRDIRIEAAGQWTKGMCVVDRRTRRMAGEEDELILGDAHGWLHPSLGNRVNQVVESPDGAERSVAGWLITRVFRC